MGYKKICTAFLAGVLAFSLISCGGASGVNTTNVQQAETAAEEENLAEKFNLSDEAKNHASDRVDKIGLSMPAKHLERWNRDGLYLKQNFENAGYTVGLSFADNKVNTQIKDIHKLINDGVDVLLIAAVDGTMLAESLEEAKAADVPVIAYDRIIESDSIDYYVTFDNYLVGQLQGEFIRSALNLDSEEKKSYNMEIVSGYSADKNADEYYYGAHDLLEPYIDAGILVIPSGEEGYSETETIEWSTKYAKERISNILDTYYSDGAQLDAVLCANDSAAIGVSKAIASNYKGTNTVILTGQDGDEENLKNIIDGKQSMTVYKCLVNESKAAYDLTVALIEGEEIGEGLIEKSGWDFDCVYDSERYSNGTEYMESFLLTPVVVTKDNIQEELIDKGFYKWGKDGYPKAAQEMR